MSVQVAPTTTSFFDHFLATTPIQFSPAVPMSQDQFFDLCQQNHDLRFERNARGELFIMPPAGGESSIRNVAIVAQLYAWSRAVGKGKVTESSGGFVLPNGSPIRAPDASWISPGQLAALTPEQLQKFLPICPYFLVESLSPTDSLKLTQDKMVEYLANGCQLGWLIDPDRRQVHVYRPGQPVQVLDAPKTVSGDPELPGFVLDLEPVWRP